MGVAAGRSVQPGQLRHFPPAAALEHRGMFLRHGDAFHQRQPLVHGGGQFAQAQEIRHFTGHAQFHHPVQAALQLLRFGFELRAQHQQGFRRGQQHFARLGQRQPPATAVEQRHAQALLQGLDLRGARRLGQRQRFGRLRPFPQTGDRDEGADLIDFHGRKFRPRAAGLG
ncbi:hypothetical protein G6F68_013049 [Rhizopus microsporus]|nr:hypothetical protein G6F68_013049 [Rhizopus microsporus]